MSEQMKIGHLFPLRTAPLQASKASTRPAQEFQSMLAAESLKFSHHAEARMKQRGIQLQPESLSQIVDAVEEAASKGAQDSLIVYRDIAMIVNVPSRTVVTAMDGRQMKSNLFTQIDSAIILT
jgi:flagellar operon protein